MLTICNIWTRSLTFIVGASFDKFNVALQFGGLSEFIILITIVKHLQVANGSSPLVCFQLVYWNIKCTWQYNNFIRSTICYILSWIGFNVSFTLKLILAFNSSKVDPTRGGWRCIDSLFEERPLPYCSILNTTTCVSIAITKRRWLSSKYVSTTMRWRTWFWQKLRQVVVEVENTMWTWVSKCKLNGVLWGANVKLEWVKVGSLIYF
jgi:hypothetical protein